MESFPKLIVVKYQRGYQAFWISFRILNKRITSVYNNWFQCLETGHLIRLSVSLSLHLFYITFLYLLPPESILLIHRWEIHLFCVSRLPIRKSDDLGSGLGFNSNTAAAWLCNHGQSIFSETSFLIYKMDSDNINHSGLLWGFNSFVLHHLSSWHAIEPN